MTKIAFYLIKLISYIPEKYLYRVSNFVSFLIFRVFRYRRKVVYDNIKNSFPDKSKKEVLVLRRKFYNHFADYILESVKLLSGDGRYFKTRVNFLNLECLQNYYSKNQSILILSGHVFNWEILNVFASKTDYKTIAIYKKQKNKFIDNKFKILRSVFGTELVSMDESYRRILKGVKEGNSVFFMVADQSPHKSKIEYDLDFLNQKTPVFVGFDKLARKLGLAVIYFQSIKEKRGHYKIEIKEITSDATKEKPYFIVHKFFDYLENTIVSDPSNWLWSHKRWKYKRDIDYNLNKLV